MSKRQWLSVSGVWVMVFLFLGFTSEWHQIIAIISGIIIIAISYNLPAENKSSIPNNSSFVENEVKIPVIGFPEKIAEKEIENKINNDTTVV